MRSLCSPVLLLVLAAVTGCAAPVEQNEQPSEVKEAEEPEREPSESTLAEKAYGVLKDRCWGCHGEPGKEAFGETTPIDWILDYDMLIETNTVIPGSAGKSRLIYITAVEGKMPRAFDKDGIPSVEDELTEEELQTLIEWVKADAPRWDEPD